MSPPHVTAFSCLHLHFSKMIHALLAYRRARVDVWCFGKDGIDAVRAALRAGKEVSDDKVEIIVKLIAPPQYVVVTSCFDKEMGMQKIQEVSRSRCY